jgi:hypothetical protein
MWRSKPLSAAAVHTRLAELGWWYWLVTAGLLGAAMAGLGLGFAPVVALTVIHTLHWLYREGSPKAFPVQVRIGYLAWLVAGLWPPLAALHWIQLAGTIAMVTVSYCPMARLVSLLPWNRQAPLTTHLVLRTFLRPPVRGSILEAA